MISFSPLSIPLSSGRGSVTLIRRDLFDARFQLMSAEGDAHDNGSASDAMMTKDSLKDDSDESSLGFLDNPSDLIPGVYEGGLKTWECSLDLVDYLDSLTDQPNFQGFSGRRILEVKTRSFNLVSGNVTEVLSLARMWDRCPIAIRVS